MYPLTVYNIHSSTYNALHMEELILWPSQPSTSFYLPPLSSNISDGGRYTFNVSKKEVRLSITDTAIKDAGSWTCRAQVFQNETVKMGDAVEYSIQLVVIGEDIYVSQNVLKL